MDAKKTRTQFGLYARNTIYTELCILMGFILQVTQHDTIGKSRVVLCDINSTFCPILTVIVVLTEKSLYNSGPVTCLKDRTAFIGLMVTTLKRAWTSTHLEYREVAMRTLLHFIRHLSPKSLHAYFYHHHAYIDNINWQPDVTSNIINILDPLTPLPRCTHTYSKTEHIEQMTDEPKQKALLDCVAVKLHLNT